MSTQLTSVPANQLEGVKKLDTVITEVMSISKDMGVFERAFVEAKAFELIQNALTPEFMKPIQTLMGTRVGFLTDRDKEPTKYEEGIIKKCVIEALMNGLSVRGNQFNVLAGNMYTTKEGFTALLRKVCPVYDIEYSLPSAKDGATSVYAKIKWDGKEKTIQFPVKVNSGMGNDAILGKAERKAKKWLYMEITGKDLGEGDTMDTTYVEIKETKKPDIIHTVTEIPASLPNEVSEELKPIYEFISKAETKESFQKRWDNSIKKGLVLDINFYNENIKRFE